MQTFHQHVELIPQFVINHWSFRWLHNIWRTRDTLPELELLLHHLLHVTCNIQVSRNMSKTCIINLSKIAACMDKLQWLHASVEQLLEPLYMSLCVMIMTSSLIPMKLGSLELMWNVITLTLLWLHQLCYKSIHNRCSWWTSQSVAHMNLSTLFLVRSHVSTVAARGQKWVLVWTGPSCHSPTHSRETPKLWGYGEIGKAQRSLENNWEPPDSKSFFRFLPPPLLKFVHILGEGVAGFWKVCHNLNFHFTSYLSCASTFVVMQRFDTFANYWQTLAFIHR